MPVSFHFSNKTKSEVFVLQANSHSEKAKGCWYTIYFVHQCFLVINLKLLKSLLLLSYKLIHKDEQQDQISSAKAKRLILLLLLTLDLSLW